MTRPKKISAQKSARFPVPAHPTVRVRLGEESVRIDKDIATLVLETWRAGVRTHCSCQDSGSLGRDAAWMKGRVQLGFPSVEDARRWLRLVAVHRKGVRTLYHRMTGSMVRRCASRWRWEVSAYDATYDWSTDTTDGPATLDFRVFVYLPRADLAAVVRRLRKHNGAANDLRDHQSHRGGHATARVSRGRGAT